MLLKKLAVFFLATVGLYAQEHPIIQAVRSTTDFRPSMVKKEWQGSQAAHDALVAILQQPPKKDEWSTALKYLAVVDSTDRQLATETIGKLMEFAVDTNCFGSKSRVPGSKDRTIPEFAFKAKTETVAAISYIIEARINLRDDAGDDITTMAEEDLAKLSSPVYWSEKIQWDPAGHEQNYPVTVLLASAAVSNLADACTDQSRKILGKIDFKTFLDSTDRIYTPFQQKLRSIPVLCQPSH